MKQRYLVLRFWFLFHIQTSWEGGIQPLHRLFFKHKINIVNNSFINLLFLGIIPHSSWLLRFEAVQTFSAFPKTINWAKKKLFWYCSDTSYGTFFYVPLLPLEIFFHHSRSVPRFEPLERVSRWNKGVFCVFYCKNREALRRSFSR